MIARLLGRRPTRALAATAAGQPVAPYGRRCALTHPDRRPAHRVVASYQDAHPGVVDRGMVHIDPGQHRAPAGDDTPTVPIPRVPAEPVHPETARIVFDAFVFARPVPSAVAR